MKKKAGKGVCQPSLWGILIRFHTTESHTLGTYTETVMTSQSPWGRNTVPAALARLLGAHSMARKSPDEVSPAEN